MRVAVFFLAMLGVLAGCDSEGSPRPVDEAPGNCRALVGTEPWIVLFTEANPTPCVLVGVHQDLQIWNKGFDDMTVEWFGDSLLIRSDYNYVTGPIGELLTPGTYRVDAGPYVMPVIRVIDPASSTLHMLTASDSGLGPVEIGMTLAEASAALGQEIKVDEHLASGPRCWLAVVEGDPYSPIVSAAGDGSAESVVTAISVAYPKTVTINPDSACR